MHYEPWTDKLAVIVSHLARSLYLECTKALLQVCIQGPHFEGFVYSHLDRLWLQNNQQHASWAQKGTSKALSSVNKQVNSYVYP